MRYFILVLLIPLLLLSSGCVNGPAKPATVYVCPDARTVADPRDCSTDAAQEQRVVEKPCNCNCACTANQSDELQPPQMANDSSACTAGALFVGSKTSQTFHHLNCSYAGKIKEENRVCFPDEDAALAAGYAPCKSCME